MGDVACGDVSEAAHAERIAAGDAAAIPGVGRQLLEERQGRRTNGTELAMWLAHGR